MLNVDNNCNQISELIVWAIFELSNDIAPLFHPHKNCADNFQYFKDSNDNWMEIYVNRPYVVC